MASVLGTAVHGVVEDLLTIEAPGPEAIGWMGDALDEALERRWLEAHTEFHRAPRHGRWKEDRRAHARDMAVHGLDLLLAAVGAEATTPDRITGGMWEAVRSLVLEVEVEATTFDDRLMGRIDLLLEDRDEAGQRIGFRVADLKTGRPPKDRLDSTVERQLLMYRDLISVRHPGTPVRAEGWYTEDRSIHEVSGPDVLEEAYEAWEATRDLDGHFPPSPGPACDRFCDWKAWCPHWWTHAQDAPPTGTFRDMVVLIHDRKGRKHRSRSASPSMHQVEPSPRVECARFGSIQRQLRGSMSWKPPGIAARSTSGVRWQTVTRFEWVTGAMSSLGHLIHRDRGSSAHRSWPRQGRFRARATIAGSPDLRHAPVSG